MAPLIEAFPVSQLQAHVNTLPNGKVRKEKIDLEKCELKEMKQYFCELSGPQEDPRSRVICEEFIRSFRKCADGLTVETTAWEGLQKR